MHATAALQLSQRTAAVRRRNASLRYPINSQQPGQTNGPPGLQMDDMPFHAGNNGDVLPTAVEVRASSMLCGAWYESGVSCCASATQPKMGVLSAVRQSQRTAVYVLQERRVCSGSRQVTLHPAAAAIRHPAAQQRWQQWQQRTGRSAALPVTQRSRLRLRRPSARCLARPGNQGSTLPGPRRRSGSGGTHPRQTVR